jgi:hypothetical protein
MQQLLCKDTMALRAAGFTVALLMLLISIMAVGSPSAIYLSLIAWDMIVSFCDMLTTAEPNWVNLLVCAALVEVWAFLNERSFWEPKTVQTANALGHPVAGGGIAYNQGVSGA